MPKSPKRPIAVTFVNKLLVVATFIEKVKNFLFNIDEHSGDYFPTPLPTITSVAGHVVALETAQTLAETHATGTAAARDVKYNVVVKDVRALIAYVQLTADAQPTYDTAQAVIEAAGLGVRVNGVRVKAPLAAKNTKTAGKIMLIAKSAGKNSVYEWQISDDGAAWNDLPFTTVAKTAVENLETGSKKYVRVRATTKESGTGNWSSTVLIVVT